MLTNEMKNYFEIKRQIAHDIDWTKSNKTLPFFEEAYHDGSGYVDYLFEENNKWLNLSFIYKKRTPPLLTNCRWKTRIRILRISHN